MSELRIEGRAELDYPAQIARAVVAEYQKSASARYKVFRGAINWGLHQDELVPDKCLVAVIVPDSEAGPTMWPKGVDNEIGVEIEVYTRSKSDPGPDGVDDAMMSQLRKDLWVVMQKLGTYKRKRIEGGPRDEEKLITGWSARIAEKYDETRKVFGIEASVVVTF